MTDAIIQKDIEKVLASGRSCSVISEVPLRVAASVTPSDPDFPFDFEAAHVTVTFPSLYPQQPCYAEVTNRDLSAPLRTQIEEAWRTQAESLRGEPMLPSLLQWLESALEDLLVLKPPSAPSSAPAAVQCPPPALVPPSAPAAAVAIDPPPGQWRRKGDSDGEDDYLASRSKSKRQQPRPAKSPPPATPQLSAHAGATASTASADERADSSRLSPLQAAEGSSSSSSSDTERDGAPSSSSSRPSSSRQLSVGPVVARGTELRLFNLHMFEIGLLRLNSLRVVVACARCKQHNDLALRPSTSWQSRADCSKCHGPLGLAFRPQAMFATQEIAGYFDAEACGLFDLLPCDFLAQCFSCDATVPFKQISIPHTYEKACHACHAHLSLSAQAARFRKITDAASSSSGAGAALRGGGKGRDPNMPPPGQPLPNNGTCAHYKHSFRWLRFPCCGRAYPCDVCHDSVAGHEMKFANRMICGFCAHEQPFASSGVCSACKRELARSGLRKELLSDKDSRKYRGVAKTQSRKADRVGPKKPA